MLTVHSVKLINSWATDTVYFIIVMITMLLTFKKLDKVIWAIMVGQKVPNAWVHGHECSLSCPCARDTQNLLLFFFFFFFLYNEHFNCNLNVNR